MNWEAIGAVGELLGALAVATSLLYASLQVRQAKIEMKRSISQHRADALAALYLNRASNAHLCAVLTTANAALGAQATPFVEALTSRARLTVQDAVALHTEQEAWWLHGAQIFSALDELPAAERTEFERATRKTYGTESVSRLWYETTKASLNPDVVHYVDTLLAPQSLRV